MRKQNFMDNVKRLEANIEKSRILSISEACALLNVGPSQLQRYYGPVIHERCPQICFDGKEGFKIVAIQVTANLKLDAFKERS